MGEQSKYRYTLNRIWLPDAPILVWVMLNPSTADAHNDDPTIRRCSGFTRLWSYGRMVVVNLFAYRATNPKELLTAEDPVGIDNDRCIRQSTDGCDVVCAWGAHGYRYADRVRQVRAILVGNGARTFCLGLTKKHQPRHPLYVNSAQKRVAF